MSGCATQGSYFRLEASLTKDVRTFNSVGYLPLIKLCDVYGLKYKLDNYINTATIEKENNKIILRSGSDTMFVNGSRRRLEAPVLMNAGALFVPVSFAKNTLAPIVGVAPAEEIPEAEISKRYIIKTIVIDAGHGGKDVGAVGRRFHLREKNMALELAHKIKEKLSGSGIRVIMTRSDDTFIPLARRAKIANQSGADLFVSVHINASRTKSLSGFECYYLSNTTDDNARALEAYENASIKIWGEAQIEHSKRLDRTLWDMALTENRLESAELASSICSSVSENFTMGNRGIRAARFYVLKYTRMPAVLVEAGYISNKYEELKLKDSEFLDKIADAVSQGILRYKRQYEKTEGFTRT